MGIVGSGLRAMPTGRTSSFQQTFVIVQMDATQEEVRWAFLTEDDTADKTHLVGLDYTDLYAN